jgi:hypothetical protein
MSVKYCRSSCYGVIITEEIRDSIKEKIVKEARNLGEDEDDEDEAITDWECFCHTIDSWCNDSLVFFGISKPLDGLLVYPMEDLDIVTEDEINKFKAFCDKYKLWDCFEWEPQKYLIDFCF